MNSVRLAALLNPTHDRGTIKVRTLPYWGIWFMVAHSALLIGATLVLGWRRHGLRRTAPVVGAMTLLCTLIIAAVARFGAPDPVFILVLLPAVMAALAWLNWPTLGPALGFTPKQRKP